MKFEFNQHAGLTGLWLPARDGFALDARSGLYLPASAQKSDSARLYAPPSLSFFLSDKAHYSYIVGVDTAKTGSDRTSVHLSSIAEFQESDVFDEEAEMLSAVEEWIEDSAREEGLI